MGPHNIGTIYAAIMFFYWTDPDDLTRMLFGSVHDTYRDEWRERYRSGFGRWFGHLDYDRKCAYMLLAVEEYGEEARRWVATNEEASRAS